MFSNLDGRRAVIVVFAVALLCGTAVRLRGDDASIEAYHAPTARIIAEATIDEWMDGADVNRVAGRWYAGDDRLLIAYTSVGNGSERRPNVYFSPGVYGEARGGLNIEPTRDE